VRVGGARKAQGQHGAGDEFDFLAHAGGQEEHPGDDADRPPVGQRARPHRRTRLHPQRTHLPQPLRALQGGAARATGMNTIITLNLNL
jgi:hypothetical protein